MIDVAKIVRHEADEPGFIANLFHADLLAGEDSAEVDFPAFVTDPAATGDRGGEVMDRILEFAQTPIGSARLIAALSSQSSLLMPLTEIHSRTAAH